MKVLNWLIILCGLWEAGDIAAIFVPDFGHIRTFVWNHIFTGIFLIVAGAWATRSGSAQTSRTLHWSAAAAGAWLILASFLFGPPAAAPGTWNDIIVGGIVILLGVWAARVTRE